MHCGPQRWIITKAMVTGLEYGTKSKITVSNSARVMTEPELIEAHGEDWAQDYAVPPDVRGRQIGDVEVKMLASGAITVLVGGYRIHKHCLVGYAEVPTTSSRGDEFDKVLELPDPPKKPIPKKATPVPATTDPSIAPYQNGVHMHVEVMGTPRLPRLRY